MRGLTSVTGVFLAAGLLTGAALADSDGNGNGPERRMDQLQKAVEEEERAQSARTKGASMTGLSRTQEDKEIRGVLERQQAAWNRGDIDAFMQGYWKSDNLRFASGNSVTRGWQATLDRYKRRYDSRAKMGKLSFSDLDIRVLSADAALVFGRFTLEREGDTPTGLFSLLFRKINDRWVIVHDHTSSD